MQLRFNQKLKHAIGFALVLISLSVNGCQESNDQERESKDILANQPLKQDRDDKKKPEEALMDRVLTRRTDDLSEKWKTVRVLVSFNKTNFFEAGGQIKGLEAELMRQYEKYLRQGAKINVIFIAQPFKELIPALIDGRGDVAAAGLTITPERQKQVEFTDPYIKNIDEIIVAAQGVTGLEHKTDLSGRKIHVVSGSSYVQHLKELNHQFAQDSLKPIEIVEANENLESEDLMQMVNAGIFELMVVDNHIAKLWSMVLKNVILREDLKIHSGGNIAWAVRKNNPRLLSNLNTFLREHREGTLLGNMLIKRYYEKTKWIQNPLEKAEKKHLKQVGVLFRKYAKMYGFDWLKIAALAYQESRFDQEKKSGRGAVGVMQIKPETAADSNVNIKDVFKLENNIHAGVKYLAFLRDRYFDDAAIDPNAKVNFTAAAYNAGPARIESLRRKAPEMGLDQNKWFFNVEHVARKEIGTETVQYVANLNKYYIAYKSMGAVWKKRKIEKDKLKKSN
ncbi:MAG: lytic transglycosylase F [Desulfobacterales bacterium]|jgi:membrane-bound lytic murein transglycosylase MltF|nr:lytic transglycosylase F [Desulfobacterales bacterium]